MSTSPILELVDIIDQNRWQDLRTVLAPDCVIERPGSEPLVGLERIERFYREERPIASGLHKIDHAVADTEAGACWGTFNGTTKAGGSVEARFADTFTLKAGLITSRTTYVHGPH